jgi:nucleoside-diphosphate-sugar epimerase
MASCVVAGAGGFIGGHLVPVLRADGGDERIVDTEPVDREQAARSE